DESCPVKFERLGAFFVHVIRFEALRSLYLSIHQARSQGLILRWALDVLDKA
ncbi:hypothetical protein NPIL_567641, partial [Nephila pilipes]